MILEAIPLAKEELPPEWANLPAVLTTKAVSDLLKVHPNTVTNLIERGELRGFKVGRVYRVHRRDLLRYAGLINDEDED